MGAGSHADTTLVDKSAASLFIRWLVSQDNQSGPIWKRVSGVRGAVMEAPQIAKECFRAPRGGGKSKPYRLRSESDRSLYDLDLGFLSVLGILIVFLRPTERAHLKHN